MEDSDEEDESITDQLNEIADQDPSTSSSRRQTVMQQLLNELLMNSDWLEKEKTHPFSTLEVIIEEVTPCSSSQQLENNLSTIKAGLRTHRQDLEHDSASDSDDEGDLFYNMFKPQKNENYTSDESSLSPRTVRRFNGGNTSNTNGEPHKDFDRQNKNKKPDDCKHNPVSTTTSSQKNQNKHISEDDVYRKYEKFINDDERYIRSERANRRNQFSTLNRNYERSRQINLNRKSSSTTNITKTSDKHNKTASKPKPGNKKPAKQEIRQKSDDNNSFTCLNTYSIKNPPFSTPSEIEKYTQVLEGRLQYFQTQYCNVEKELIKTKGQAKNFANKYAQKYDTSSSEDDGHWTVKSSFKDRGDFNTNNSVEKPNLYEEISPEESPISLKNASFHDFSDSMENLDDIPKVEQPPFITDTPDSGLQTHSSVQNLKSRDDESKIMYPSVSKNVATQITDVDWEQICTTKKEMSERGFLRLNLPNSSSDDEALQTSHRNQKEEAVELKTVIVNSNTESMSSHSTSVNFSNETPVPDVGWLCFPCSNFVKCLSRH